MKIILCLTGILVTCLSTDAQTQEIEYVLTHLISYNNFAGSVPNTGASSSDGHVNGQTTKQSAADIAKTPSFMEGVTILQETSGLKRTGKPDAALVKKVTSPRCGMSDPPPPGSGIAEFSDYTRWRSNFDKKSNQYHLTYSFFKSTFPAYMSRSDILKGVLAAMCVWEKNSNVRFTKNMGDANTAAHIKISFGKADHGDSFPFDGPGGTLAHAFYPENGHLHFDDDEKWFLSKRNKKYPGKKDIFTVAAHELGHILGLKHSLILGYAGFGLETVCHIFQRSADACLCCKNTISKALMAPYYNFVRSFETYSLPQDEKNGMIKMYGRLTGNPLSERKTACLLSQGRVSPPQPKLTSAPRKSTRKAIVPTRKPITPRRKPITPTWKPITPRRKPIAPTIQPTATTTHFKKSTNSVCKDTSTTCDYYRRNNLCTRYKDSIKRICALSCGFCKPDMCKDDSAFSEHCAGWKAAGFCSDPKQGMSMSRICKKTCGFCTTVLQSKPPRRNVPPKTACDVKTFDTVSVRFDQTNGFFADFIKENYFFPLEVQLLSHPGQTLNLLNRTHELEPHLKWRYDPKSIPAGVNIFSRSGRFERSDNVAAIIRTRAFIIIIQKNDVIDEYRQDGPHTVYVESQNIQRVFPGYPHSRVDAAYVEENNQNEYTFSLFRGKKIWQYKEDLSSKLLNTNSQTGRRFVPIQEKQGKSIAEWHGVGACNLDAVFSLEGRPYFLKGNTFWPAMSVETPTARDITYNFFRCWHREPHSSIPVGCNSATKASSTLFARMVFTLVTLVLHLQC